VEAESRQLGCIQVVDKVDVFCRSYPTVQSSSHGNGVLSLVKFGSVNVRRRSDGKEARIPVKIWVTRNRKQRKMRSYLYFEVRLSPPLPSPSLESARKTLLPTKWISLQPCVFPFLLTGKGTTHSPLKTGLEGLETSQARSLVWRDVVLKFPPSWIVADCNIA